MTSILEANNFLENNSVKTPTKFHTTAGSINVVTHEIFIDQTFYSVTVLKKVKRCKNEVLKTTVSDLSLNIIKRLNVQDKLRSVISDIILNNSVF